MTIECGQDVVVTTEYRTERDGEMDYLVPDDDGYPKLEIVGTEWKHETDGCEGWWILPGLIVLAIGIVCVVLFLATETAALFQRWLWQ